MSVIPQRFGKLRDFAVYCGVAVFSVLFLYQIMDLGNADIRVPFCYVGDALLTSLPIKGIIDHGWYLENPSLGAPWGHKLYDYPFGEIFYFLCFKILSLFTDHFGVILNVFFILTFPATAVTSLWVFRRLGVGYGPAILGSLLFTFQAYHLLRHEVHLFLSSYFLLPLGLLIVIRAGATQPPYLLEASAMSGTATGWQRFTGGLRPTVGFFKAALVCALLSVSGFYYAFFTGLLVVAAGGWAALRRRSAAPLVAPLLLAGLIVVGMALTTAPSQSYWRKAGKNPVVARREYYESEHFGLKVIQLLLPTDGHRISSWREGKEWYNTHTPLVSENRTGSLGVVGAAGFLFLIGCAFVPERLLSRLPAPLGLLTHLNLFSVLLGTIGGFSTAFAMLATPQIRAYNRISIVIAFWALCAVVIVLDAAHRRWGGSARFRMGWGVLLCALTVGGLLDETGLVSRFAHGQVRAAFYSDDRFVRNIENSLPSGAMVFQLPYAGFPEIAPPTGMGEHQHLRGYLHSKRLRWSYATMRGRPEDDAHKALAALPPPDLVQRLRALGFAGIYIDRTGYGDKGAQIEAHLARVLGVQGPQFVSDDGQLSFFRLGERTR